MLFEMKTAVAIEKTQDTCVYQFPETLWQFIKEYYLPKFFKKWFPVRYTTLKILVDLDIKYLDIPVSLPDKKPKMVITKLKNSLPDYMKMEEVENGMERN
jgi:hypothetical protein